MTEKNNKEKVISLIVLCVSIVALATSLTYAYFVSQVGTNEQEKVTIRSGDLALTFRDNDETVENTERSWSLGDSVEKELVIENTGTKGAYAKISWDNLINTYLAESLTYTLEEKSDDTGADWKIIETENANVPRSDTASKQLLVDQLYIPAGHTYTYRVKIIFEDLADIDQTQDINAKFITKFTLEESKESLYNKIKRTAQTTSPNFANPATTDETADGLFSMSDDYGTSYYFRGTASNNYIKFGKNASGQDMWWRIIRFNGDGTVRMQYDGAGTSGTNTYTRGFILTNQVWNSNYNDAKYVGWMFGGTNGRASTSKEEAQRNETDSEVKTKVDEWYKTNIVDTEYNHYVADSIFCNDRSTPGKSATGWTNDTGLGYGSKVTAYGAVRRFMTGNNSVNLSANMNPQPRFTCSQENHKFTAEAESGGNGALTYPVGLITADEIVAAGSGKYGTTNQNYYLHKENTYWSFSPCYKNTTYANVFVASSDGRLSNTSTHNSYAVAPVINLKAEYLEKLQGDGTINNPYFLS